jgi:hypothetical protein
MITANYPAVFIGATVYDAPEPTGADDTDLIQQIIDLKSSEATVTGIPVIVKLAFQQLYLVKGIALKNNVLLDLNQSTLKKTLNANGDRFTSPYTSVVRSLWILKNGSWYGSCKNSGLINGTIDANNKDHIGILEFLNVENFTLKNLTIITSTWSCNWSVVLGGRNVSFTDSQILGATRVFQDGCHFVFGDGVVANNLYIESGDDVFAAGNDDFRGGVAVYFDDQELKNFSATNIKALSTRGFAAKIYNSGTFNYGYTKALKVFNGYVQVVGKAGMLRNGGVQFVHGGAASIRDLNNIKNVAVNANIEIGTDGTAIYSATAGTLVGSPTAVSKATSAQVSLAGHGLTAGTVVAFVNIAVGGMTNLQGVYQVRSTNLATNTFELSDTAYRNNIGLNSTGFNTWTSGDLIECSSGNGYVVGDMLYPSGGTAIERASFRVTQVGPNGEVEAVIPVNRGNYSVLPSTPNSATGGSGTGCTLFLELAHSGVNAYGCNSTGSMNCSIEGSLKINDTSGAATRFLGGYIADSQNFRFLADLPYVPANGGVQVLNEAVSLKSRDNIINCHMTGNPNISTFVGYVMGSNSYNTQISGVFDEMPTNVPAIRGLIAGNQLDGKAVTAISAADPAVVTINAHGRAVGEFVTFSGNVLTVGDINNIVYRVRTISDANNIILETLDGNVLTIAPATVSTGGTLYLSMNTMDVSKALFRKAAGVAGTIAFNNASSNPHRLTSLRVRDCDCTAVDNVFASVMSIIPNFSAENILGYTKEASEYRSINITHDALVSSNVVIRLSGNTTFNAPTNPRKGQVLNLTLIQPSSGGPYTVTYAGVFSKVADGAGLASQKGSTQFIYDGTSWVQTAGLVFK